MRKKNPKSILKKKKKILTTIMSVIHLLVFVAFEFTLSFAVVYDYGMIVGCFQKVPHIICF